MFFLNFNFYWRLASKASVYLSDLLWLVPLPWRHTPRLIVMHVVFRYLRLISRAGKEQSTTYSDIKIFEYAANKQACKQLQCNKAKLSEPASVNGLHIHRGLGLASQIHTRWKYRWAYLHCYKRRYPIPSEIPSAAAQNTRLVGKKCHFRLKSPFILETVRDKPIHGCYGTLIGSHRWRIDPCRCWWPWVTLKGGMRGSNFSRWSP